MPETLSLDELSQKLFERGETAALRLAGVGKLPGFANEPPEKVLFEWIGPAFSTARSLTNGAHPDSNLIVVTLAALWLQVRGMAP